MIKLMKEEDRFFELYDNTNFNLRHHRNIGNTFMFESAKRERKATSLKVKKIIKPFEKMYPYLNSLYKFPQEENIIFRMGESKKIYLKEKKQGLEDIDEIELIIKDIKKQKNNDKNKQKDYLEVLEENILEMKIKLNQIVMGDIYLSIIPVIEQTIINTIYAVSGISRINKINYANVCSNDKYRDEVLRKITPRKEDAIEIINMQKNAEVDLFKLIMEQDNLAYVEKNRKSLNTPLDRLMERSTNGLPIKIMDKYKEITMKYEMDEINRIYSK